VPDAVVTPRLLARAPVEGDLPSYSELLTHPEVAAWLRPAPLAPRSPGDVAELLRRDRAHWDHHGFGPWVLLDRADGSFVGRAGLAWTTVAGERRVELPWALLPSRWGGGLATEAAQAAVAHAAEIGLSEVVSVTLESNVASRRVMEKAGLRMVGCVEHAGFPHVLFRLCLRQQPDAG
jgi:RimJ/RimL family protein N-acetyltransferase